MRTDFIKTICSSFFIIQAVTAIYGSPAAGGNGTSPILVNNEGTPVANVKLVIDLEKYLASATKNPFDDFNETLSKREDSTDFDSEADANSSDDWLEIYTYNYEHFSLSDYHTDQATELEKRRNIHECTTWVEGARKCVNQVWDGLSDVWAIAFKIKQLATAKQCTEIHGQQGGLYYRYWATGGNCGTTAMQKTIAAAIHAALKKADGEWTCNVYCITMTHGGNWEGTLLIGPDQSAMWANCGGAFKGCYDIGCKSLEGWYNCNS